MISFTERFGGYEVDVTDPIRKMSMIIAAVKELSIIDVLENYGVDFSDHRGSNYMALCPFHMDNRIGSFSANTSENYCYCFSCGVGGDAIHSVSQILDVESKEAVLQIAADMELIDEETFEELLNIEYVAKKSNNVSHRKIEFKKKERPSDETLKMWTDVYEFIQKEWKLTSEHEKALQKDRQLPQNRINSDYFTMRSTDQQAVVSLIMKLKRQFPQYAEKLATIPGFYEQKMDEWRVMMFSFYGIGILIRDAKGRVIGVQIRMDKKNSNNQRYLYFSGEATSSKYQRGGASCGTPIDVLWPATITDKTSISITEGRFKSEILTQQGLIGLSVQGIHSFSGIEDTIKDVEEKIGRKIKKVTIFYDGDMTHNIQVFKATIALAMHLEEVRPDIKVIVAMWNEKLGKGIDDMIFAGHKNEVRAVQVDRFMEVFDKAMATAEDETGFDATKVAKLTKDERTLFINAFGDVVKKELL